MTKLFKNIMLQTNRKERKEGAKIDLIYREIDLIFKKNAIFVLLFYVTNLFTVQILSSAIFYIISKCQILRTCILTSLR